MVDAAHTIEPLLAEHYDVPSGLNNREVPLHVCSTIILVSEVGSGLIKSSSVNKVSESNNYNSIN